MPAEPDRAIPPAISRDELALKYLEQLPFTPYPVQEQALFAWFAADEGVLVCAPTGMGKTLIAEAAAYAALSTGSTIYYTTPVAAPRHRRKQRSTVTRTVLDGHSWSGPRSISSIAALTPFTTEIASSPRISPQDW